MFHKFKLKKEINKQKRLIKTLEQRRLRSQAALVEAILNNATPDEKDVDRFNDYSTTITVEREKLKKLIADYEKQ